MSEIIKDFPSLLMIKISNIIMLDSEINKMLYYNNVTDKDIYSLDEVKNPIGKLKDNKVFIDRRIDKVQKDSDISVFINIASDNPYLRNYKKSRFVRTCEIEIGVMCHNDCRKILNGARESVVTNRIKDLLAGNDNLGTIGEISWGNTNQMYNVPYGFVGCSTKIQFDYSGGIK